ncbi:MAG: uracil permease [Epulopiscium sp.]|nr:uracil permease [Candidatus Epulonipiscium sp.]
MTGNDFSYKWMKKGDVDAFLGLLFDGFSKVLAGIGILMTAFQMPAEIVMNRIVPGIGVALLFGSVGYFIQAVRLANKEERQDVTAIPYGIGASQIFGWLFLIIGPVYFKTGDPVFAWQVGLAAGFVGGIIECIGAFVGKWIVKVTPQVALVGNLAAAALIWLSLVSILNIYEKPFISIIPMTFLLICFFGKIELPFNIPVGLISVIIGAVIAWTTGQMQGQQVIEAVSNIKFTLPIPTIKDVIIGLKGVVPFLPIIIPMQISNFLSTLQCIEGANVEGDEYSVKGSMFIDGFGTIIGSLFGNPFPTTAYIGHGSWKEIGAGAGYSLLHGITYLIITIMGAVGILTAIIPYQAVMPILVYVGLIVSAQAVNQTKKDHIPAVFLGIIPLIAQYVETAASAGVEAAGTTMEAIGVSAFQAASFPIEGVQALSYGAFLSSVLLAAWLAEIIDNNFKSAAIFMLVLASSAWIGLIHSPNMGLGNHTGVKFAIVYLVTSIISLGIPYLGKLEKNI